MPLGSETLSRNGGLDRVCAMQGRRDGKRALRLAQGLGNARIARMQSHAGPQHQSGGMGMAGRVNIKRDVCSNRNQGSVCDLSIWLKDGILESEESARMTRGCFDSYLR